MLVQFKSDHDCPICGEAVEISAFYENSETSFQIECTDDSCPYTAEIYLNKKLAKSKQVNCKQLVENFHKQFSNLLNS